MQTFSTQRHMRLTILLIFLSIQLSGQSYNFSLYFDMDKAQVTSEHENIIEENISLVDSSGRYHLAIVGFTDFVGSTAYNQKLSERRASAIAGFILSKYNDLVIDLVNEGQGEFDSHESNLRSIGVREHRKVIVELILSNSNDQIVGTPPPNEENRDSSANTNAPPPTEIIPVTEERLSGIRHLQSDSLAIGQIIILEDLNFHAGRHYLLRESIPRLKDLLATLLNNPKLHIRIEGHICCGVAGEPDGFDQDTGEQKLSYNRAHNIYQYLIRNGVEKNRLSFAGFGYSRPIYYPEQNREEQKRNRRVEIIVTKV